MKYKYSILTIILLHLIACKTISNITGINKKTCLVLSVGGAKGIAHIGAIEALKEKNIKIDCVFGNSMGAVIGGLYANKPDANLTLQYRETIAKYIEKTKNSKLFSGLIFGTAALILSGGVLGWETIAASIAGAYFTDDFSNSRFEEVLNELFQNKTIEQTKIPFATSYQMRKGQGMDLIISKNENLAHAISKSANNPFIFKNTGFNKIDPGADRIAAIPIEDACKYFNPTNIIVINVSGNDPVWTSEMNCPITLINIQFENNINFENVIKANGLDFQKIVELGYKAVNETL